MSERGQKRRRSQELGEILRSLAQHSLADWQSFLEESSSKEGSVIEDLYSVFTGQPLQNSHLRVSGLSESCRIQCLLCDDKYSHPLGPAEKQIKLAEDVTPESMHQYHGPR